MEMKYPEKCWVCLSQNGLDIFQTLQEIYFIRLQGFWNESHRQLFFPLIWYKNQVYNSWHMKSIATYQMWLYSADELIHVSWCFISTRYLQLLAGFYLSDSRVTSFIFKSDLVIEVLQTSVFILRLGNGN